MIWAQPQKCTKEHNIPKMHISHPLGKFVLNLPEHSQTHKYEKCPYKRNRTKNVKDNKYLKLFFKITAP